MLNLRNLVGFILLVIAALVLLSFSPVFAVAAGEATPDFKAFFGALLSQALDTFLNLLLTFGGGVIPAFAVAWVVDKVVKAVPFLAPFRELVKQYLLNKLEELKRDRTKAVALKAGEEMRERLRQLQARGEVSDAEQAVLKSTRNNEALFELVQNRTARNLDEAERLVKGAVAELKTQGVNP